jgi:hypothetical protein
LVTALGGWREVLSRWGLGDLVCLGFNGCEFFEVFIIGVLNEWLR